MKKRGQFYLLAAIIIIVLIIGLATVLNYTKRKSEIKLYDLKQELGIESGKVLDYGTYNIENEIEKDNLLKSFIGDYNEYAGEGKNMYFVFGNFKKIFVIKYEEITSGSISIGFGKTHPKIELFEKGRNILSYIPSGNKVTLDLGESEYEFELKPGENFYFIVSQQVGDETHVVISE
jgi:hypothetical protein